MICHSIDEIFGSKLNFAIKICKSSFLWNSSSMLEGFDREIIECCDSFILESSKFYGKLYASMIDCLFNFCFIFFEFFSRLQSLILFSSLLLYFLFPCLAREVTLRKCNLRKTTIAIEGYEIARIPSEEVVFSWSSLFWSFSSLLEKLFPIEEMITNNTSAIHTILLGLFYHETKSLPFFVPERFHEIPSTPELKSCLILSFDVFKCFLDYSGDVGHKR